jgi:uncharacterized protein (TIGR02453 family)
MSSSFPPSLFTFLRDLKRHNDREWFAAHRDRYVEAVETPMLTFITALVERMPAISKEVVVDPRRTGGSMMRIYRDTRFSPDKSPFKTWVAAHFRHRGAKKDQTAPAFYLHLGPLERFAGGGVYHPDRPALTRIRQAIASSPAAWAKVVKAVPEIEGERLTRPPAGFDPAHRFIEDLKRKDFYCGAEFSEREATSPTFLDRYLAICRESAPLMGFLAHALGLRW